MNKQTLVVIICVVIVLLCSACGSGDVSGISTATGLSQGQAIALQQTANNTQSAYCTIVGFANSTGGNMRPCK